MSFRKNKKNDEKQNNNPQENPHTPSVLDGIPMDDLEFESTEIGDFSFFQFKEKGDQFVGRLICDCAESENEKIAGFEGIEAETYPEGKKVILSHNYKILQFMNEGHYKGGICRITMIGKEAIKNGRSLISFKFEQAKN